MQTVVNVNIDEIDDKFIEKLKRDFAHADVEIRLQEQPDQYLWVCSDFCVKVFFCPEFWRSNVLASRSLRRRSGTLSVEIQV